MIPTKLTAALVATTLLVSSPAGSATAISVLFIGNSFTFAAGSAVRYYASAYGSYLEALVIFGGVTGRDPRSLGGAECSGFELGLSRPQVAALQQVAFDQLAAVGTVTAAPPVAKAAAPARCTASG